MLRGILAQLRTEAKDHPGKAMGKKLKNGLHLSVSFQGTHFRLVISREKVTPALGEWNTVLKSWPDFIDGPVDPEPLRAGTRVSLRGDIPVVKATQLALEIPLAQESVHGERV